MNGYTGLGSKKPLGFHIENAAIRYLFNEGCTPKGLLLAGIRNEMNRSPYTQISDGRLALKKLPNEHIEQLKSKSYIISLPKRWQEILPVKYTKTNRVPIIEGSIATPIINAVFYGDRVESATPEAKTAFEAFRCAIKDIAVDVTIEAGMAVFINNRIALHSRTAFNPYFDETGRPSRWLQRIFVGDHLWGFRD